MDGALGLTGYLKRLVSSLAAYQVADVVSKFIAVLLLPVYTRYIAPSGYGVVELLANGVIFVSIVVRFGIIEAFLRYYFTDEDQQRRDALARRSVLFLLITSTIAAAVLAAFAEPLSKLVLGHRDTTIFLIAVLGLWSFTNLELAYALLRVEEQRRTYAIASLINVGLTIAASLVLVVGFGDGARGLLLGNYGATTLVLFGLWWTMRHRLAPPQRAGEDLPVLLRFGLPTMPAEISVYALSIVDRYYIYHDRGASVGRPLLNRGQARRGEWRSSSARFQYAWPPLAYSVTDDAEAARLYGLVTHLLRAGQRLGRRRPRATWPLGPAAAGGAFVLRRAHGADLGRARLGDVRSVGGVPGDRRTGQGDHPELPRVTRRVGSQCRADRVARAAARDRGRGPCAVRRICRDARRHVRA